MLDMTDHDNHSFLGQLLSVMDCKHHWAWPHFAGPAVTKKQLKTHFCQEYQVYVRDFPVFLARIHGQSPPQRVRTMLAENIYEEDTGRLSVGRPHPTLFMEMMNGLGFSPELLEQATLLPASRAYREWLDSITGQADWLVSIAVLTIFVEGSIHDRRELLHSASPKTPQEIEDLISAHPLVRHHGLSPDVMDLVRAHQMVEAGHRHDAYETVVGYAEKADQQSRVLDALRLSLDRWLRYRDGVADACGIVRP
jgi:pyrroloquinoline-quinone synthase